MGILHAIGAAILGASAVVIGDSVLDEFEESSEFRVLLENMGREFRWSRAETDDFRKRVMQTAFEAGLEPYKLLEAAKAQFEEGATIEHVSGRLPVIARGTQAFGADSEDVARLNLSGTVHLQVPANKDEVFLSSIAATGSLGGIPFRNIAPYLPGAFEPIEQLGFKGAEEGVALASLIQLHGGRTQSVPTTAGIIVELLESFNSSHTKKEFLKRGIDIDKFFRESEESGVNFVESIKNVAYEASGGDVDELTKIFNSKTSAFLVKKIIEKFDIYQEIYSNSITDKLFLNNEYENELKWDVIDIYVKPQKYIGRDIGYGIESFLFNSELSRKTIGKRDLFPEYNIAVDNQKAAEALNAPLSGELISLPAIALSTAGILISDTLMRHPEAFSLSPLVLPVAPEHMLREVPSGGGVTVVNKRAAELDKPLVAPPSQQPGLGVASELKKAREKLGEKLRQQHSGPRTSPQSSAPQRKATVPLTRRPQISRPLVSPFINVRRMPVPGRKPEAFPQTHPFPRAKPWRPSLDGRYFDQRSTLRKGDFKDPVKALDGDDSFGSRLKQYFQRPAPSVYGEKPDTRTPVLEFPSGSLAGVPTEATAKIADMRHQAVSPKMYADAGVSNIKNTDSTSITTNLTQNVTGQTAPEAAARAVEGVLTRFAHRAADTDLNIPAADIA